MARFPLLLLLLLLFVFLQPDIAAVSCKNSASMCANVGTCFDSSTSTDKCYHSREQSDCQQSDQAWCGDQKGKQKCGDDLMQDHIRSCEECLNGLCSSLGWQSVGTSLAGDDKTIASMNAVPTEKYGKWCPDATTGNPDGSRCKFECTNDDMACEGSRFYCGDTSDGPCLLQCDATTACQNAHIDCGNNHDCFVTCRGAQACQALTIDCPPPPFKCEVLCATTFDNTCNSLNADSCGGNFVEESRSSQYKRFHCDDRLTCVGLGSPQLQLYSQKSVSMDPICINECPDDVFHVGALSLEGSFGDERICGKCPAGNDCSNFDACVPSQCMEGTNPAKEDKDCCALPSTMRCKDSSKYEVVTFGLEPKDHHVCAGSNIMTTCCRLKPVKWYQLRYYGSTNGCNPCMALTPSALGDKTKHSMSSTCDKDNGLQVFRMEEITNPPSDLQSWFKSGLKSALGWYRLHAHSNENFCLSVTTGPTCRLIWWEECSNTNKKQMWHFQKFVDFEGIVRNVYCLLIYFFSSSFFAFFFRSKRKKKNETLFLTHHVVPALSLFFFPFFFLLLFFPFSFSFPPFFPSPFPHRLTRPNRTTS